MRAEFPRLEAALHRLYRSQAPDPRFVQALEQRLSRPPATPRRRLWLAWAPALFLLALVLWIGPRRVLAQVERWLGYVPNIGFVDLEQARVLPAPVSTEREGVTLIVSQLVATPKHTWLTLQVTGLPPESPTTRDDGRQDPLAEAALVLPDGREWHPRQAELGYGHAVYQFPALPADVQRLTLVLGRLPLVAPGVAPEDWRVALHLRATHDTAAPVALTAVPVDAADTHHGVTLRVLDVATDDRRTAVHWQLTWTDTSWGFFVEPDTDSVLEDDLGQVYHISPESGPTSMTAVEVQQYAPFADPFHSGKREGTLTFAPLSQAARQVRLVVPALQFQIPDEVTVPLDLGEAPQVGQSWTLNREVTLAGVSLRLLRARLVTTREWQDDQGDREVTVLVLESQTDPEGERTLIDFSLSSPEIAEQGGTGTMTPEGHLVQGLVLADGADLPHGVVHLRLSEPQVLLRGPWTVSWETPATLTGARWQPGGLTDVHHGLQVALTDVLQTDRLTGVRFAASGLPEDATGFLGALIATPRAFWSRATLTDDRGNRHAAQWEVEWETSDPFFEPRRTLAFPPADPLAGRWTVQVPAMAVQFPGEVTFTIQVPPDAPHRRYDQPPFLRGDWAVDAAGTLHGFDLHLTGAALVGDLSPDLYLLGTVAGRRADGIRLLGFRRVQVTGPDGVTLEQDGWYAVSSWGGRFRLQVPVAGPGDYRITLREPVGYAEGPWRFTWQRRP